MPHQDAADRPQEIADEGADRRGWLDNLGWGEGVEQIFKIGVHEPLANENRTNSSELNRDGQDLLRL
jgi:hypothetical protein